LAQGLRQRIDAFQPLGQHCGAVHAALFMDRDGELLLGREDIGRHNALDKLIGALIRQRIDTTGGLAIVTSRCSLELIQKVLRAGIQTLVSLSAPTGLAVQWARKHNLNLIHLPKHSAPRVYSPAAESNSRDLVQKLPDNAPPPLATSPTKAPPAAGAR
jgi:FdhD protein